MMAAGQSRPWRGELRMDEPMAHHTSWHAGGAARRFYKPAGPDDLRVFLAGTAPDQKLLWVGLGSNLLVRDGGFPGTVVFTFGALDDMDWVDERTLHVGAGVACAKVARTCARNGLTGAEFLAGIPGSMGGALAMNAGAFGGETWELVQEVETADRRGVRRVRRPHDYCIGYRSVCGPGEEWFVSARLRLVPGDAQGAQMLIRELLDRRGQTQPTQYFSCGSVFRNPPGDHAARLIETAGLKGMVTGGARVSDKHANFIINTGSATAADIEELIVRIQARVREVHGIMLEPEVRIVGERSAAERKDD
jgi:UDP-N-acetylmuramate dehydrogenase